MSAHAYTISTSNITTTTASVVFTITADYSEAENVDLTVTSASGTVAYSNTVVIPASAVTGDEITTSLTGLRSNTTYTIDDDYSTPVTFTTLADNTAKTATQSQWEDLADRVNAAVIVGETVSTPSSVAYVGTDNIVNNAVTTAKLANNSVTADKIDFTTMEPTVLYTGPSGTSGSISLSDSFSNYDYVTIFFHRGSTGNRRSSVTLPGVSTGGCLSFAYPESNTMTIYALYILISGSTITLNLGRALAMNSTGGLAGWGSSNELVISEVVGFKMIGN